VSLRCITVLLVCLAALARISDAQETKENFVRIEVVVTAVSGNDVYFDRGRDDGIVPGDDVRLFPNVGPIRTAVIRSVSGSSSRAVLRTTDEPPDIGTRGEVLVPPERLATDEKVVPPLGEEPPAPVPDAGPEAPGADSPEHPPWEGSVGEWDQDLPLLAPIEARDPEERPWRARGSLYTSADITRDSGAVDQTYTSLRTGLDLGIENPFRRAGELEIGTDFFHRRADTDDDDDTETKFVVDRLSYHRGGRRGAPTRFEVGRFLHYEFPEFGIHDGIDVMHRFSSGSRAGVSLGILPEPSDTLSTGDDVGATVYYRYVANEEEDLSLGLGYQKTWHNGEADRDLVVSTLEWTPSVRARLFTTAWLDYYTSGDDPKDEGFELTQLQLNGSLRWDTFGLGLNASQIRFPELLRDEFNDTTADSLADERIRRVGLSSWYAQSRRVRWDARVDAWEDEDDSGEGGELRVTLRDMLWDRGSFSAAVFSNTGSFSEGRGLRFSAAKNTGSGSYRLAYDVTNFEQDDDGSTDGDILQQTLTGYYDTTLGRSFDLSLFLQGTEREGDSSVTLGITLYKRL
jgi:hypothetical protein